ncbi:zinc finger, CCHC-type [Artemisia annua]|uniref:Zinc finger, CCHC-type n=1 Tax=Artemisia annua TaxID=35608 RepID=A0A2U1NQJ0_ARTAN|nr:zinc finger, CCHC-type [Artemisia annua]
MALVPNEGGSISYQVPALTGQIDCGCIWPMGDGRTKRVSDPKEMVLQMASYTDSKQVWDGLKTRYLGARSLGYELEEVDLVKRLLDAMPKSFLKIVASIEQCFELDTMLFDEAVGRLMAYEERLKSHVSKGMEKVADEEEAVEGILIEVVETEEKDLVDVIRVGFDAMIVEHLGTLAMSAQNGRTRTGTALMKKRIKIKGVNVGFNLDIYRMHLEPLAMDDYNSKSPNNSHASTGKSVRKSLESCKCSVFGEIYMQMHQSY